MITRKQWTFDKIAVTPTETDSIAEYNYPSDTIRFWNWSDMSKIRSYIHKGESLLEFVVRVVAHEELHRILYKLEGWDATFYYDVITNLDIGDLP